VSLCKNDLCGQIRLLPLKSGDFPRCERRVIFEHWGTQNALLHQCHHCNPVHDIGGGGQENPALYEY